MLGIKFILISLTIIIVCSGCNATTQIKVEEPTPTITSPYVVQANKILNAEESLPVGTKVPNGLTPDNFLKSFHVDVQFGPKKFMVHIPSVWDVKLGEYPLGLYWRLANVFSEDAGLSLVPLKGSSVEVWQYTLRNGLTHQDQKSEFQYPSNVNLLVKSEKVVGAWLSFNIQTIGPSINKRYLDEITGLTFEQWSDREGIFISDSSNKDLVDMKPTEVLTAFFNAIENKNTTRANACLDQQRMLEMLTVNLGEDQLYNPGFGENNSIVSNIISATPISYKLLDHESQQELQDVSNLSEVVVQVSLKIQWKNEAFNNPDGKDTRYAAMRKYANGWKLGGLGTGP